MEVISMFIKDLGRCCLAAVLVFSASCVRNERTSVLVQKVEAAGAGPLTSASTQAMSAWFQQHRSTAVSVEEQCRPLRERATAGWNDTTEGRVCSAARSVAMFVHERRQSSGDRFRGGWY